jgi:tetratricopeptide (TPR) repeat protein
VQVLDLLETADQKLRAGKFEESLALFDQALEKSVLQKESVATLRDKADQIRVESIYSRAVLLESDFRYPEAIALFDALLAEQGGFYLDARTRRDTLATYMADAERLYNEAAQAGDRAKELKLLRQVELIWPTYKDVAPRLRAAAKAEQAP